MLTDPEDLVLDIFAGSNTTGMVAEAEGRRWLAFDERRDYLAASAFRFLEDDSTNTQLESLYGEILKCGGVEVAQLVRQPLLFA